ncbi:site-specific integrase [Parvibacter caecicola]|uniref:site-specific integrase n=1 Tax=Parvibacter caecicola TaxID=747645 RepID=UPI0027303C15|nr:site-specific integrase [Parvibacter caecicola]
MSVRKRPDGGWIADVTVGLRLDGRPDRRTSTHRTKKAAEEAERKLLLERDLKRGKSYGSILFRDFVEGYFWPQKEGLARTTRGAYKRDLKLRLLPAFGDVPVEDIDRLRIQSMISSCQTRKVASNARGTLSSILALAVEMGAISVNPAGFKSYRYPSPGSHAADHYGEWLSTFAEIQRVLDYMEAHHPGTADERMCVLGLCFGLRKEEALGLDWEQVDLPGRKISIVQAYTTGDGVTALGDPKTDRARREVPMVAHAARRMAAWGPSEGPVVVTVRGGRMAPSTARDRMQRLFGSGHCFDDGRPLPRLTQFSMRHSFGTSCINAGIEVAKVSKWMGHCDVNTTYNRYVKPLLADLRGDADTIDAAMGGGR